jgi:methyltransferase (TIGR00027 family)
MSEPIVTHVSETALWIAADRARETRRPDSLFRDHLAERLAGEHGHRIARRMHPGSSNWPIVVRTRLIDELIHDAIEDGADRVLNLAAGLDTRPYRLPLPASLTWIEADFPDLIDDKERALAGERPVCQLRRERVDLADAAARAAFLDRALAGARRAVVLTEGLLVYLEPSEVQAIARDLHARPAIHSWIMDLASPGVLKMVRKRARRVLSDGVQMKFAPAEGVRYFEPLGWKAAEVRHYFREGVRLRRVPRWMRLFALFPDPDPTRLGDRPWGGIVRYERL